VTTVVATPKPRLHEPFVAFVGPMDCKVEIATVFLRHWKGKILSIVLRTVTAIILLVPFHSFSSVMILCDNAGFVKRHFRNSISIIVIAGIVTSLLGIICVTVIVVIIVAVIVVIMMSLIIAAIGARAIVGFLKRLCPGKGVTPTGEFQSASSLCFLTFNLSYLKTGSTCCNF
jgi:hypothetical protein